MLVHRPSTQPKSVIVVRPFKITIDTRNFDGFERALRDFPKLVEKEILVASKRIGLEAEGILKKHINKGGVFAANSPMTTKIKGSNRPLVNHGDLVRSITHDVKNWSTVAIGVLKQTEVKDWDSGKTVSVTNIAWILHQGAVVDVTPKMRAYFLYMSSKYPDRWYPLKQSTTVLVIPPRPFMEILNSTKSKRLFQNEWKMGVERVLQIIAAQKSAD